MSRVRARRVRDMIDHDSCQIDSVLQVPLLNRVNCLSQGNNGITMYRLQTIVYKFYMKLAKQRKLNKSENLTIFNRNYDY